MGMTAYTKLSMSRVYALRNFCAWLTSEPPKRFEWNVIDWFDSVSNVRVASSYDARISTFEAK